MADKLILNANMICKADRFNLKNVAVEKVIEVSKAEFKRFVEKPLERNYYVTDYDIFAEHTRGKFRKLQQIGSVCFGRFGIESPLLRAIAEVFGYIIR